MRQVISITLLLFAVLANHVAAEEPQEVDLKKLREVVDALVLNTKLDTARLPGGNSTLGIAMIFLQEIIGIPITVESKELRKRPLKPKIYIESFAEVLAKVAASADCEFAILPSGSILVKARPALKGANPCP